MIAQSHAALTHLASTLPHMCVYMMPQCVNQQVPAVIYNICGYRVCVNCQCTVACHLMPVLVATKTVCGQDCVPAIDQAWLPQHLLHCLA